MRRTPRLGLRGYLVGFFALAAIAPTVAALPFIVSASSAVADKRTVEGLRSAGQNAGARLARTLYTPWRQVDGLAAMASREDEPTSVFRIRLDTARRLDDRLSWIGVAGPNGRVTAAAEGMLEGQDVSARDWFRSGLEGPFAGDVREALLLQRLLSPGDSSEPLRILDFSKPVRRASDGAVVGVIGAHIPWSAVRDLVREAVRPERAEILLVSRDGTVIIGPPGVEGTRIQHLRGVLAAGQGVVATAEEEWPDGGRHLSVTMPVPGHKNMPSFGWSLILRQPSAVAHAPAREMAARLLPPMLGVSLLLLAAGALLARAIARPLSRLAASAEAMAAGQLDEPVPEHREHREAAVLGAALARIQSALTACPAPAAASAAASPQPLPRRHAEQRPAPAALADAHQ
ncbi:cache domain-containing protein [Craurococcus roseus]|uniref:Cache domain-containing protein n=1 Tax=Craurococcus roseus TaxID=77585 RepID=A0ABN1FVC4_9PROT